MKLYVDSNNGEIYATGPKRSETDWMIDVPEEGILIRPEDVILRTYIYEMFNAVDE
jgi:hypothetical protein